MRLRCCAWRCPLCGGILAGEAFRDVPSHNALFYLGFRRSDRAAAHARICVCMGVCKKFQLFSQTPLQRRREYATIWACSGHKGFRTANRNNNNKKGKENEHEH